MNKILIKHIRMVASGWGGWRMWLEIGDKVGKLLQERRPLWTSEDNAPRSEL